MTATLKLLDDPTPTTHLPAPDEAITGEVVTLLSKEEARKLTANLHQNLENAQELIIEAFEKRVWLSLGYKSWNAYITYEFTGLTLTPPKEDRLTAVVSYAEAGMSTRAISAVTGLSVGSISRLQSKARETGLLAEERESVGLDGKVRHYRTTDPSDKANELGIDLDAAILDTPASAFGIGALKESKPKNTTKTSAPASKPTKDADASKGKDSTVPNGTVEEGPVDDLLNTGFENISYLMGQLTEQIQNLVMSNNDKNFTSQQYPYSLVQELLRSMASSAHLLKRLNLGPDLLGEHEQVASQLETIVTNLDTELEAIRQ